MWRIILYEEKRDMINDILMVDDDLDLNEIVGMYLENHGMAFRSIHKGCLLEKEIK